MNKIGGLFAYIFWIGLGFAGGIWFSLTILKGYVC